MFQLRCPEPLQSEKTFARNGRHRVPLLIVRPKAARPDVPGILWIHGGGYFLGMKEMVYMSRAAALAERFGAVIVSPGYRLAFQKPYPAAIEDCYAALLWMKEHAAEIGVRPDQLMIGGESAGGGLCAALCMMARDREKVSIACQMPLYPMLDNTDTETSRNNHGRVWNTRRNHIGWRMYLGRAYRHAGKNAPAYASPARATDYSGLPPCCTFVCDGEPFYAETLAYVRNLREAGVEAECRVYPGNMHAFDMLRPKDAVSRKAAADFEAWFAGAVRKYFAVQK